MKRRKFFKIGLMAICIALALSLVPLPAGITANTAKAAFSDTYPYQAMRLENYDKGWNLNILGYQNNSEVNVWPTNGYSNERWKLSTTDGTYFKIINETTGLLVSPLNWSLSDGNSCVLYADSNRDEQLWRILGVDMDPNGDYLTYKIVNKANTSMALVLNLSTNKTMLAAYSGSSTHKWKLVSDGLVGFAGYAKTSSGANKTGTIGGVLGKIVFVNTLAELKSALLDSNPLTIVVSSNIDNFEDEVYDLRIASNKTLIGSYDAHRFTDARLRTDDYFQTAAASNNIIIKNIDFEVKNRENVHTVSVYGSRNVWIDHNTFNSSLAIDINEVGKFIWVYSSSYGNQNPDYVTVSYNKFYHRYWTVLLGTSSSSVKMNGTVMFNYFDSCVRRTPQVLNGNLHVLNNFIQRTLSSTDNVGYTSIIGASGGNIYSDSNRFNKFQQTSTGSWDTEIYVTSDGAVKDVGSYTDKGTTPVATPYPLPTPNGTVTTFNPSTKYSYPIAKAYDASGYDVKTFATNYVGAVSSASALKYIHYQEFSNYLQ